MPHEADVVDVIVVAPGGKSQKLCAKIGEPPGAGRHMAARDVVFVPARRDADFADALGGKIGETEEPNARSVTSCEGWWKPPVRRAGIDSRMRPGVQLPAVRSSGPS